MAHPLMFDDDDPYLARVRDIVMEFPGRREKVSHGRPALYTTKMFAYYGGSRNVDREWVQHPRSIVVLPGDDDRHAMPDDERVYVPAYLGPSGWIGIDIDDRTDWFEIAELLDASYRLTAPRRLVAELDDPAPSAEW